LRGREYSGVGRGWEDSEGGGWRSRGSGVG
jgi:hypothetical protein